MGQVGSHRTDEGKWLEDIDWKTVAAGATPQDTKEISEGTSNGEGRKAGRFKEPTKHQDS